MTRTNREAASRKRAAPLRQVGHSRRRPQKPFPWFLFLLIALPTMGFVLFGLGAKTGGTAMFIAFAVILVGRMITVARLDWRESRGDRAAYDQYRQRQAEAKEAVRKRRRRGGPSGTKGKVPPRAPLRVRLQRLFDGWIDEPPM